MNPINKTIISVPLIIIAALNSGGCGNIIKKSSLLESALKIGVSTKDDFEIFQREGGLETSNVWNEFKVNGVKTGYNENNVLSVYVLTLDKKGYKNLYGTVDANYTNISDKMEGICGNNWNKQDGEKTYVSVNGNISCTYEYPSSSYEVYLTVEMQDDPQKISGSTTSSSKDWPSSQKKAAEEAQQAADDTSNAVEVAKQALGGAQQAAQNNGY